MKLRLNCKSYCAILDDDFFFFFFLALVGKRYFIAQAIVRIKRSTKLDQ